MSVTPPPAGAGFRWYDEGSAPVLRSAALAQVARHAFTSRQLRLRGGDPAAWGRVAAQVSCPVSALHRVRQVHGAVVAVVEGAAPEAAPLEADALITQLPGAALAVVTADCVPVLLADPVSGAVGAVHAGWRGTAADVVGAAVRALGEAFGVAPGDLVAAIGPSIGPECYDVGEELPGAFDRAGVPSALGHRWFSRQPATGRLHLDLWRANADLLIRAGVAREHIHVAELCTRHHPEWFESYRAEGPNAGRMAAVIVAPGG